MRGKKGPFPSLPGLTHHSPPFAAAVPAVGAGLAPLWGGHILLPVLGWGGRAGPFADLGGEEETKKWPLQGCPRAPSCRRTPRRHRAGPRKLKQLPCPVCGSSPTCFLGTEAAGAGVPQQAAPSQLAPRTVWTWGKSLSFRDTVRQMVLEKRAIYPTRQPCLLGRQPPHFWGLGWGAPRPTGDNGYL